MVTFCTGKKNLRLLSIGIKALNKLSNSKFTAHYNIPKIDCLETESRNKNIVWSTNAGTMPDLAKEKTIAAFQ